MRVVEGGAALKELMDSKLDESQKAMIDEFSEKAKGLEISELFELKKVYENKLKDGF